ncbi:MAG: hypothetical protein KJ822_09820 [Proteobacteria bacterium]|nr:hypothetical protein [Pseudomonadota bacterium]MBU4355630.1 hypothetical protein [Pseudomonadota bacterium]
MSKSRWISGEDLMKDWEIKELELFDIVQNGLQPHDILCEPIHPPDISEKLDCLRSYENELKWLNMASVDASKKIESLTIINERNKRLTKLPKLIAGINHDLSRCNKYSWNNYDLPKTIDEAKKIYDLLKGSLFLKTDINSYKETMKETLTANVIVFLSTPQLHAEVEMLYKGAKRTELLSDKLREALIQYFRQNREDFKILKEEYLVHLEILSISMSNARRDIIGPILPVVVNGKGWSVYSKEPLYAEYKNYKRQATSDKIPTKQNKPIIR